jgi:hypothetical protein
MVPKRHSCNAKSSLTNHREMQVYMRWDFELPPLAGRAVDPYLLEGLS